ncbi:MAG TPA: ATP-binding cassette domain-containing protein, partial [Acidimicrobiales bacterium]|nr:ATP-binding cassette domain-containing protein [Acidimicrobiales bacterium]
MTEATTLYELRGVGRRYLRGSAEVAALADLDLDVAAGEFLSIEGPSGSGKSTLLQLLGALDTPTTGTIAFDGRILGAASDAELTAVRSRDIGFVFQQFNLIPTVTALDNVELAMVPMSVSRRDRRQRARALLEQVGLGHRVDHLPSRLSGGEQQRVAIA